MANQDLTLAVCVPLLIVILAVVAVLGTRARLRFAKRLATARRDKEKTRNWFRSRGSRQTWIVIVALLSLLGMVVLGLLVFGSILPPSKTILVLFGFLALTSLGSGALLLRDIENFAK